MGKDIDSVRTDTAQNLIEKYSLVREHVTGIYTVGLAQWIDWGK